MFGTTALGWFSKGSILTTALPSSRTAIGLGSPAPRSGETFERTSVPRKVIMATTPPPLAEDHILRQTVARHLRGLHAVRSGARPAPAPRPWDSRLLHRSGCGCQRVRTGRTRPRTDTLPCRRRRQPSPLHPLHPLCPRQPRPHQRHRSPPRRLADRHRLAPHLWNTRHATTRPRPGRATAMPGASTRSGPEPMRDASRLSSSKATTNSPPASTVTTNSTPPATPTTPMSTTTPLKLFSSTEATASSSARHPPTPPAHRRHPPLLKPNQ